MKNFHLEILFGSIPFIDFITGIGEEESRFSTVIEKHANPGFLMVWNSIWGSFIKQGDMEQ